MINRLRGPILPPAAHIFPRDTDLRIVRTQLERVAAERELRTCLVALHRTLGSEEIGSLRGVRTWNRTIDEALLMARTVRLPYAVEQRAAAAAERIYALRSRLARIQERLDNLERVYIDHQGWWRYYVAGNGPVHLTEKCRWNPSGSTAAGRMRLVPTLSGREPASIADCVDAPHRLCGACFQRKTINRLRPRGSEVQKAG